MKELVHFLQKIKSNTLNNYVLAGLSSSLIGEKSKIRMFEASRETYHFISQAVKPCHLWQGYKA